jgi:SagB-type dehydrogenase family enzyme
MEPIILKTPRTKGALSVEEALNRRKSVRSFRQEPLDKEEVGQILWAAYGKNLYGKKTAPSAGATYPLEIYLAAGLVNGIPAGVYRYREEDHALELHIPGDIRRALAGAAFNQQFIAEAPACVIVAAEFIRTTSRYGERGKRYVFMDAGHVGENVHLQAEALGLGTVMVGAFDDDAVSSVLKVKKPVLYLIPIGRI